MIDPEYCQLMAQYNRWMNQKLYAVCRDIPDAQRKRDLGAFFGSIHETLNHLLWADKIWTGRFTGEPFTAPAMGRYLYGEFEQLAHERDRFDDWLLDWTHGLSQHWLEKPFTWTSGADQTRRTRPTWILLTHLFNHQTHHRGQITTSLTTLGYEPGVTDLPWLPALERFDA